MSYISAFQDTFGFRGQFTPAKDLRVCEPYRLVGATFSSEIDTSYWTAANSGTSSAAGVSGGIATLTSGTANSGYGQIISVRQGRFLFVHPHLFKCAVRIPALGATNCTRRWGALNLTATTTPQDGFYFSLDGADALSVNYVNAGSVTSIASGSFNGAVATYAMDTNVHAYEIIFFEMGAWFFIDDVLIHKFTPTTAKLASTMTTGVACTAINSAGGTTSGSIHLWAASILRLGRSDTANRFTRITTAATYSLKGTPGTLHTIVLGNTQGTLMTVYDQTTAAAPIISVITGTGVVAASPVTLDFHVDFNNGLTIVSTGTWDATVTYE